MPWFNQSIVENRLICAISVTNTSTKVKKVYRGLIDTGATKTYISKEVKDELKLQTLGVTNIRTASEAMTQATYTTARVAIIIQKQSAGILFSKLTVLDSLSAQDVDAIIGMDLISNGVLIVHGNTYELAF